MDPKHVVFLLLLFFFNFPSLNAKANSTEVKEPWDKELKTVRQYNEAKAEEDFLFCMFYYFDEKCPKCSRALKELKKFSNTVRDVVYVYTINCDEFEDPAEVSYCNNTSKNKEAKFACYIPPLMKINPYTKKPMLPTEKLHTGETKAAELSDFVAEIMPAYRKIITTLKEFKRFLNDKSLPVKMVTFTNKKLTPPLLKGLSAIYRDRVDFAEVKNSSISIMKDQNVQEIDLPELIIYRHADGELEKIYFDGKITFDAVKQWMDKYALEERVVRERKIEDSDSETKGVNEEDRIQHLNPRAYEKKLLNEEKMVLVHIFEDNEADSWKPIRNKIGSMVEFYNLQITNKEQDKLAKETLGAKKIPCYKFFPPGTYKKGQSKIFFQSDAEPQEVINDIYDLVKDNSVEVNEKTLSQHLLNTFEEGKHVVFIFYKNKEVLPVYRYLTHLSLYTDSMKFFSFYDPSEKIIEGFSLKPENFPQIVLIVKPDEEGIKKMKMQQDPGLKMAFYPGKPIFSQLAQFLQPVKSDRKSKKYISQRELIDELNENFGTSKIGFLWIDGLCHSYLLKLLELNEDDLPQLIGYYPGKKTVSLQVGSFEKESLSHFIESVLQGKAYKKKIPEELDFDDFNCAKVHDERFKKMKQKLEDEGDMEDEIMQEILREKALREREEKEAMGKKKQKAKPKKNEL